VPLAYLFLNAILCSSSKLPNGYSVSQRHFWTLSREMLRGYFVP
jgi:hypothetical protein